ncbi:MAG TPA: carboxypeptidase-like regulatory domain-containing protein, partial [Candidatus Angelobacter sp.]|nr:carboxypeptidase-like regulatory domain-containing protein [Candidatus Angelobacter sp.]
MFSQAKLRIFLTFAMCFACRNCLAMALPGLWQTTSPSTGQLQVTVMDQNGQPLALVIVIVQQNDKTVAQERTTASGNALVRQLAPGTYKVLVEKQGFYTIAVPKLEIVSGQQAPLEVRLQPVREYEEE